MTRIKNGTIRVESHNGHELFRDTPPSRNGFGPLSSNPLQLTLLTVLRMVDQGDPVLFGARRIVIDLDTTESS